MFLFLKNKKGFTLIELLVVVAIIGVLASVVLASLNSARAKSRDARRRVDLRQVQTALELYYNDNNSYPVTGVGVWYGTCSGYGSKTTTGAGGWVPNVAPTYISSLPVDPKPLEPSYCYLYQSRGTDFKLLAYQTVESAVPSTDSMYDPLGRGNTYAVYTQGASAW